MSAESATKMIGMVSNSTVLWPSVTCGRAMTKVSRPTPSTMLRQRSVGLRIAVPMWPRPPRRHAIRSTIGSATAFLKLRTCVGGSAPSPVSLVKLSLTAKIMRATTISRMPLMLSVAEKVKRVAASLMARPSHGGVGWVNGLVRRLLLDRDAGGGAQARQVHDHAGALTLRRLRARLDIDLRIDLDLAAG